MRRAAQIASGLALAGSIVPALFFFADRMDLDQVKTWMLAATVLWFVATPLWMEREHECPTPHAASGSAGDTTRQRS